jgi:hypothetical protein
MEAVPLSTISVADCTRALVFHWINCLGIPNTITVDRGLQFTSNPLAELNISHSQTTAHYPEVNGVVERLHRCLKDALCALATVATWAEEIPWVLLALCS